MGVLKNLTTRFLIITLTLIICKQARPNNLCESIIIPNDRSVDLSIHREKTDSDVKWKITGAFVVDQELNKTYESAKKIERLENVIPLVNIFNLSEDRTDLQCGLQIFFGVKFQQTFKIEPQDSEKKINVRFIQGSFKGLQGQVCFLEKGQNQTAVTFITSGRLTSDPVPFFLTNSMLEGLSKSVLRRWRTDIESQN
jgi:ribosome-associated toxin RatA of RatAB toxin-antitoxin module